MSLENKVLLFASQLDCKCIVSSSEICCSFAKSLIVTRRWDLWKKPDTYSTFIHSTQCLQGTAQMDSFFLRSLKIYQESIEMCKSYCYITVIQNHQWKLKSRAHKTANSIIVSKVIICQLFGVSVLTSDYFPCRCATRTFLLVKQRICICLLSILFLLSVNMLGKISTLRHQSHTK